METKTKPERLLLARALGQLHHYADLFPNATTDQLILEISTHLGSPFSNRQVIKVPVEYHKPPARSLADHLRNPDEPK